MADTVSAADRMAIEHACHRLALDYSHYADNQQMEAWSNLFADDAEMVLFGETYKGRGKILGAVNAPDRPQNASFHSISNFRIDVLSPSEAKGTVGVTVFAAPKSEGPAQLKVLEPMIVGIYHDTYKKTAEGWRFARRAFQPTFMKAQG